MTEPWWKTGVIYQIYPRSFLDTNGSGVGDLEGIRSKLDYLEWLGVGALWLSPIFPSPMTDFGYDVADYCDIDPLFGDLATFDALVGEAHRRGLKVLLDWVPNHTSDQHPWFIESRASRDNAKGDWYWWRDGSPDRPPNNWEAAFVGGPAWTWSPEREQWYLHNFLSTQPDLNWRNPEVVDAMHDTLRFWLDRGVDGFRMDVIHLLGKDPALPDIPDGTELIGRVNFHDWPHTHEILRDIRSTLDSYPGDRVAVGEVYLLSTALVAQYYGKDDELHLAFNFPPLFAPWEAQPFRRRIDRVIEELSDASWPTWVLSNHDNPRHATRYGGDERKARAAAVLLLTLRGTPFLYAGEELGLEDAVIPPDRVVDPGGRDGCRAPIPWTKESGHGWSTDDPWLPWPPDAANRSVATQKADAESTLHLYRRLLIARRRSPALSGGSFSWLDSPDHVLAYERGMGDDVRRVAINFGDAPTTLGPVGGWTIEVASDSAGEGKTFNGELAPWRAVVLRPPAQR
ncbi:MAG TPA: alpha-amylase family glycosyl hydrolase [Acidimicrobiales bacterium]|nr:alpha-amylase family glycosyl hydrolase [Acidimicrobiales bacterium]